MGDNIVWMKNHDRKLIDNHGELTAFSFPVEKLLVLT